MHMHTQFLYAVQAHARVYLCSPGASYDLAAACSATVQLAVATCPMACMKHDSHAHVIAGRRGACGMPVAPHPSAPRTVGATSAALLACCPSPRKRCLVLIAGVARTCAPRPANGPQIRTCCPASTRRTFACFVYLIMTHRTHAHISSLCTNLSGSLWLHLAPLIKAPAHPPSHGARFACPTVLPCLSPPHTLTGVSCGVCCPFS